MASAATLDPVTPATQVIRRTKSSSARELAKNLFAQGLSIAAISEELNVTQGVLRVWKARYKWSILRNTTKSVMLRGARESIGLSIAREVSRESAEVRNLLAGAVRSQAERLAASPPSSVKELANTPERQGLAAVLKTVVDSASEVFDWQSQHTPGVVVLQDLRSSEPGEQVIDIASATEPATAVTDATIGSVPEGSAKLDASAKAESPLQAADYEQVMSQLLGA